LTGINYYFLVELYSHYLLFHFSVTSFTYTVLLNIFSLQIGLGQYQSKTKNERATHVVAIISTTTIQKSGH